MRGYSSMPRQAVAIHREGIESLLIIRRTVYKGNFANNKGYFVVYQRTFTQVFYSRGVYHLYLLESEN